MKIPKSGGVVNSFVWQIIGIVTDIFLDIDSQK